MNSDEINPLEGGENRKDIPLEAKKNRRKTTLKDLSSLEMYILRSCLLPKKTNLKRLKNGDIKWLFNTHNIRTPTVYKGIKLLAEKKILQGPIEKNTLMGFELYEIDEEWKKFFIKTPEKTLASLLTKKYSN